MVDRDNNGEQTTSRGAEWEVVQLTASTYAAAPGPNDVGSTEETKESEKTIEHGSSCALFISDHFVFPPSEHENLPIQLEVSEIHGESEHLSNDWVDNSGSQNDGKMLLTTSDDDTYQHEFSGEEGVVGYMVYTEDEELQRLILDEEGKGETPESPEGYTELGEEKKFEGSNLPCEAWWKRHATSMYHHAKEANTLWSIVVTATVVGLVILGHRWQREKWQFYQHKLRFSVANEGMKNILRQYK